MELEETFDEKKRKIVKAALLLIKDNATGDQAEWYYDTGTYYEYPPEVIDKFKEAVSIIRRAGIYMHRVDWLLSGDDGDDTFLERLKKDLDESKY